MSKSLGDKLNADLLEKLNRGFLFRDGGLGLTVLTTDANGWPNVAMAPGCVAARPDQIYLALGGKTGSLKNVERDPRVTIMVAAPDTLYYVKGHAEIVRREMNALAQEAAIKVTITEVLQDLENFVSITGGVTYRYRVMHEDFVTVICAMLDELQSMAEEK